MKVDFSSVMQSAGLSPEMLNSLGDKNSKFSKVLSEFKSKKVQKINDAQNESLNNLKDIMECQIKVHDLSMKVELVSRVAESGVSSVRKLQNGI